MRLVLFYMHNNIIIIDLVVQSLIREFLVLNITTIITVHKIWCENTSTELILDTVWRGICCYLKRGDGGLFALSVSR